MCIHISHQQRCESYVQMCGLLSKTGVEEVRRYIRSILISNYHRNFNWALEEKSKMQLAKDKDEVKRLQGSDKTYLFLKFMKNQFTKTNKAKASMINYDAKYKSFWGVRVDGVAASSSPA